MKNPATKKFFPFLSGRLTFIMTLMMFFIVTKPANAQNVITDSINVQSVVTESDNALNCDPVHRCPLLFTCFNGHCMPIQKAICTCRIRPNPPQCASACGPLTGKNETGNGPFLVRIFTNTTSTSTTILFSLQQLGKVTLKIFDPNGVLLKILADEVFEEGEHSIEWSTEEVNEGVYVVQIQSAISSQMEKLTVTK